MIDENLKTAILEFSNNKLNKVNQEYKKIGIERQKFVSKFPVESILNIQIYDYVVGKGNKQSFCYFIETRLKELGSIKGGSTADKKFGIYYSKSKETYINVKKFADDYLTAFDNIKYEIYNLLLNFKKGNIDAISKSKLSPMFRGKIITSYFPEKSINIFSEEYIDFFLNKLEINYDSSTSIDYKKIKLIDFKNNNCPKDWNNYAFYRFLYTWADPRNIDNTLSETEIEHYFNATDKNAGYKESYRLVRDRKLNIKNLNKLKKLYNGTCQICGKRIGEEFGEPIVEAHHIEYYSKSQNNDMSNILIVCPNHHSLIHRYNPKFDRQNLKYVFDNRQILNIKIDKHLKNIENK